MKTKTNSNSFILKPSTIPDSGIGVFILHDVTKCTPLALFTDSFEESLYDENEIPKELQGFCLGHESGKILCPKHFNRLDIGNYINHSLKNVNTKYIEGSGYLALRNIKAGEELFANYNELNESEEKRGEYYKS
jgi:hypothetical protein